MGSRLARSGQGVPTWVAVHLTHAVLQDLADRSGVDLLHIKGPTDAQFRAAIHDSTDADVLVRPAHLAMLTHALHDAGWVMQSGFEEGSAFGHAATYLSPRWGWADLHRTIPGFRVDPAVAFDLLWQERELVAIAHRTVAAPSPRAQVLIQVLHAARSHGVELPETWWVCSDEVRATVRALAAELGAQVAFAAGIGELPTFRGDPDYATWAFWSGKKDDRLTEWRTRLHAAHGLGPSLRVIQQLLRVNRAHLRMRLDHEPTARDIAAEQLARVGRALRSGVRALGRRRNS